VEAIGGSDLMVADEGGGGSRGRQRARQWRQTSLEVVDKPACVAVVTDRIIEGVGMLRSGKVL